MSLEGDRESFAVALSTVDGVTGHAYRPAAPKAGDAWPLLSTLERAEGLAFFVTWRVLLVLPQDERTASDWFDSKTEALVDALSPLAFVERIEPVTVPANSGELLALQITMRSE